MAFRVGSSNNDNTNIQRDSKKGFKLAANNNIVISIKRCKCINMPNGILGLYSYLTNHIYYYTKHILNNKMYYRIYKHTDFDIMGEIDDKNYDQLPLSVFKRFFKQLN